MAEVSVPSIATVTPTATDTVVGVQTGSVKRFSVSSLLALLLAPRIVASGGANAQAANINQPAFYAVPTSGMYRVSMTAVVSQAATTSSNLPDLRVQYTEATTGVAVGDIVAPGANTNTVGLHLGGSVVINAQQGSNLGYSTTNYASAGATPMQYSVSIKVEFLG